MALAELFELARAANKAHDANDKARIKAQMLDAGELLGLLQQEPAAWFALVPVADDVPATDEIEAQQIGRAHVCTSVTNAHLVCRLLIEKPNTQPTKH